MPVTAPSDGEAAGSAGGAGPAAPAVGVFSLRRSFVPMPAAAPKEVRLPDPISEPEFERIDGTQRPARVSEAVWSEVFPADYARVWKLAGRHFLRTLSGDEAVRLAMADIEAEVWTAGTMADAARILAPLFPGDPAGELPVPPRWVRSAVEGIRVTARSAWRDILSHGDPVKEAFRKRAWHAPEGHCLVCGKAGKPAASDMFQGDFVHPACRARMKSIGPAWGGLVVEAAKSLAEASAVAPPVPPEPDYWDED